MDLLTHIADMETRETLAKACGTSPAYLWQIATGRRRASPDFAKAIEAATNGVVPRHELRPDLWTAPESKAA